MRDKRQRDWWPRRGNEKNRSMTAVEGKWRITRTNLWGDEDLDLLGRAEIVFDRRGIGSIRVGALQAEVDYRLDRNEGLSRVDFTWAGFDEKDPVSGRGWVEVTGVSLRGRLFIHMGDDVEFNAVRQDGRKKRVKEAHG
jgi:hypothetical protein